MLVLVVAKKMRDELRVSSGRALRAGEVIAGVKTQILLADSAARLKPCPDTKHVVDGLGLVVSQIPESGAGDPA
jgi:hypothetical protein